MAFWTEGCDFTIAGHAFSIRKQSIWKDGFQLIAGDQCVCEVHRGIWSRRFEMTVALDDTKQTWFLQPAGWFTRTYQLRPGERVEGTILHTGWLDAQPQRNVAGERAAAGAGVRDLPGAGGQPAGTTGAASGG